MRALFAVGLMMAATSPQCGINLGKEPVAETYPVLTLPSDTLRWQGIPLDQPVTQTLVVQNTGTAPLHLTVTLEEHPAFVLLEAPDLIESGAAGEIRLSFTADRYPALATVLLLRSDDPVEPEIEVPLLGQASGDQDGDGQEAWQVGGLDCADGDAEVFDGADEACNGADDDCDGRIDEIGAALAPTWYRDRDADSHGDPLDSLQACAAPAGYVAAGDDCDDTDDSAFPGADEVCNLRDDDCDDSLDEEATDAPTWYTDADADGLGDPATAVEACQRPSGAVRNGDDCDDSDPAPCE